MAFYIVDVESDDQSPSIGSIVCFGAIKVDPTFSTTFYGKCKPLYDKWNPEALAISGFSREQHLTFDNPEEVFKKFNAWVLQTAGKDRPVFMSDNLAFDWQWVNFYFHKYVGSNPFGFSGRRIGDLWCGLQNDLGANQEWKKFRKTRHTHNPVDDAKGNAEALYEMKKRGLNIKI